jgi:hypothetical protein
MIGEDPQLRGGFVVLEAIVPSRRFRARGFGVEPQHKLFEDRGLLGLELDDSALRFCEASVEGSLEVTRVEFEKAAVHIKGTSVFDRANLDGSNLAGVCGTVSFVSTLLLTGRRRRQKLALVCRWTYLGGLLSPVDGSGSFFLGPVWPSLDLSAMLGPGHCCELLWM